MDPPDIFEAVTSNSWACPSPNGLAVGSVYVEIERLSSHELIFISVLTICNEKKKLRRPHPSKNKQTNVFPLFPHSGGTRYIFCCSFKAIFLKESFLTSLFHWHRNANKNKTSHWHKEPPRQISVSTFQLSKAQSSEAESFHLSLEPARRRPRFDPLTGPLQTLELVC